MSATAWTFENATERNIQALVETRIRHQRYPCPVGTCSVLSFVLYNEAIADFGTASAIVRFGLVMEHSFEHLHSVFADLT